MRELGDQHSPDEGDSGADAVPGHAGDARLPRCEVVHDAAAREATALEHRQQVEARYAACDARHAEPQDARVSQVTAEGTSRPELRHGKVATMTATDDLVAALRAQLAGDYDEHRRLLAGLDARGAMGGYTALVTAAFIEAVDRRIGPWHRDAATVSAFVSDVRARFPGADEIDQVVAERVVRKALRRGSISDIDGPAIRRIEMLLLPLMVADERYSGEGLDQFFADARKLLDS
jgi:hypothetical protein